jgi:hypothetical protein
MSLEPGSARWTTTLLALAASVAIGNAGCDRAAPPEAAPAPAETTPPVQPTPPPPAEDAASLPDASAARSAVPSTTQQTIERVRFPLNSYYSPLPAGFRELEMQPAPKFSYSRWVGGTEAQIAELERLIGPDGRFTPCLNEKLVIVQYWTTAARPGLQTIERNNDLLERFADEDVVFVAIHPNVKEWGVDGVGPALDTHGAKYPSAIDAEDRSTEMDWKFDLVPGYVLIDARGIVRAAGLRASVVPESVDALLAEWKRTKAASGAS